MGDLTRIEASQGSKMSQQSLVQSDSDPPRKKRKLRNLECFIKHEKGDFGMQGVLVGRKASYPFLGSETWSLINQGRVGRLYYLEKKPLQINFNINCKCYLISEQEVHPVIEWHWNSWAFIRYNPRQRPFRVLNSTKV